MIWLLGLARIVPWQIWLIAGLILATVIGLGVAHHQGYIQGSTAAITKIEDANKQSEGRADAAQKTVDDCYARGGVWDRANGMCVNATSGQPVRRDP